AVIVPPASPVMSPLAAWLASATGVTERGLGVTPLMFAGMDEGNCPLPVTTGSPPGPVTVTALALQRDPTQARRYEPPREGGGGTVAWGVTVFVRCAWSAETRAAAGTASVPSSLLWGESAPLSPRALVFFAPAVTRASSVADAPIATLAGGES